MHNIHIYVWYFKHTYRFQESTLFYMKYSVVAKSSDVKNNGWKVPLTELENIT